MENEIFQRNMRKNKEKIEELLAIFVLHL